MNFTQPPSVANQFVNAVLSHVRNNKDPLNKTRFEGPSSGATPPPDSTVDSSILHVGLDWGTSKTCLKARFASTDTLIVDECIPTVLGYAKRGLLDGILPNNARTLFGREALTHRRHLDLAYPSIDSAAASEFARYLRSRIPVSPETEIRAIISIPATVGGAARDHNRSAISEHFHSVILLPQPYLGALGYRDESRLVDSDYIDPVRNSIFIDIGASTTHLCLVQGYYPTADEQLTLQFGGNHIDELLRVFILEKHPDAELSPITIRHIKEQHAVAGVAKQPLPVDVVVGGKLRSLDISVEISNACNELVMRIVRGLQTLLAEVASDCAVDLLQNIVLTGGGSRIKDLGPELKRILLIENFANPEIRTVGESKTLVATGALKAASHAREHHWFQVTR